MSGQAGPLGREAQGSSEEQHGRPYFPKACIGRAWTGNLGASRVWINYLDFAFRELSSQKAFNILKKKPKPC